MKKLIGLLCIVHWPLINITMAWFSLRAPWYLSEHALVAELLAGLVNLGITLYGFSIFFPKAKLYISIVGALLFTSYQTFAFGWGLDRYSEKLQLNEDSTITLEVLGGGAFSRGDIVQLELFTKRYGFLQEKIVHQYYQFKSVSLERVQDEIHITLRRPDGKNAVLKESIDCLLED